MEQFQHYVLMALAVAFGFSWLVFVHELGHYLLAKWNGVRVHVFSIGMGPYVLSFTRGETLYVISLIPIGGYVKMAGQDDMRPDLSPSKDPRDYRNKRAGQKAAILAAGAAFNLIFAYLGFAACYYFGVEMPAPVIDKVDPKSPAGKATACDGTGRDPVPNPLQEGDRITMVNGQPIKSFFELAMAIGSAGTNREIYIQYERLNANGRYESASTPAIVRTERDQALGAASAGLLQYQERVEYPVGFTCREEVMVKELGLSTDPSSPAPQGPAERAGIRKGDRLVSIDGKPISLITDVFESVKRSNGEPIEFVVERDGKEVVCKVKPEFDEKAKRYLVGIRMIANPVDRIDPACEAYKEGLREGAYLLDILESSDKKKLTVAYITSTDAKEGEEKKIVIPYRTASSSTLVLIQRREMMDTIKAGSVGDAMAMAWADTVGQSTMVFAVLHRLITREVDFRNMAGPVGMAGILTRVASERSITYYLWFLALLSLNLGVLQFVPIPLLDGWHLVMVTVEKLKGSPVPLKVQEAFQYVGLFVILFLLVMVTKNDIMRFLN